MPIPLFLKLLLGAGKKGIGSAVARGALAHGARQSVVRAGLFGSARHGLGRGSFASTSSSLGGSSRSLQFARTLNATSRSSLGSSAQSIPLRNMRFLSNHSLSGGASTRFYNVPGSGINSQFTSLQSLRSFRGVPTSTPAARVATRAQVHSRLTPRQVAMRDLDDILQQTRALPRATNVAVQRPSNSITSLSSVASRQPQQTLSFQHGGGGAGGRSSMFANSRAPLIRAGGRVGAAATRRGVFAARPRFRFLAKSRGRAVRTRYSRYRQTPQTPGTTASMVRANKSFIRHAGKLGRIATKTGQKLYRALSRTGKWIKKHKSSLLVGALTAGGMGGIQGGIQAVADYKAGLRDAALVDASKDMLYKSGPSMGPSASEAMVYAGGSGGGGLVYGGGGGGGGGGYSGYGLPMLSSTRIPHVVVERRRGKRKGKKRVTKKNIKVVRKATRRKTSRRRRQPRAKAQKRRMLTGKTAKRRKTVSSLAF